MCLKQTVASSLVLTDIRNLDVSSLATFYIRNILELDSCHPLKGRKVNFPSCLGTTQCWWSV